MATALEHCDLVAAVLCGITDPAQAPRSICAMGHKWMWNEALGGLPAEGVPGQGGSAAGGRARQARRAATPLPTRSAATSRRTGPISWGSKPGIPIPVGAFDAHWDAIGAGCREGDVVNVVGTSTCIMAIAKQVDLIPGVCGVVKGSIHPQYFGIEAGLSATGDIFDAIASARGDQRGRAFRRAWRSTAPARPDCCG